MFNYPTPKINMAGWRSFDYRIPLAFNLNATPVVQYLAQLARVILARYILERVSHGPLYP